MEAKLPSEFKRGDLIMDHDGQRYLIVRAVEVIPATTAIPSQQKWACLCFHKARWSERLFYSDLPYQVEGYAPDLLMAAISINSERRAIFKRWLDTRDVFAEKHRVPLGRFGGGK